ncbi:MAG TPA: NUDIX domain-containing protein [Pirellulales bacterium]|nr:NUDIX domain-containing protein [Pirellulales bacterium]
MESDAASSDPNGGPPRRRGVVAVLCRDQQLLVIKRSESVVAPGAYCFPGGGIEDGETETAALIREIQEELGVEVEPVRRLWESITPWQIELAWWLVRLPAWAELRPNPAEVASWTWHTPETMRGLPGLLASNLAFLEALAAGEFCLDPVAG